MTTITQSSNVSWRHPSRLLLNAFVIFLIVYVVLRSIYVSITHDEAYTFFHYIKRPIEGTLNVTYTNNHLLNSLLARLSSHLFGESELALRLPNVLGGAAFFIFGARLLSRMHPNRWMMLGAFVALAFNTFVIDFFGLCRGYGISLGLLMIAMYYQYRSFESERKLLFSSLALIFSGAAVVANYTLFNFFLLHTGFVLLLMVIRVITIRREKKKVLFFAAGLLALLAALACFITQMMNMLLNLNQLGNFNFGGSEGLWKDTIDSLATFSCFPILGGMDWIAHSYVPLLTVAVLLLAAFMCVLVLKRRKFSANELFLLFLFLMITGCGLAIVLQNKIMNIPISRDRTVIYFLPLFSLMAICVLVNNERLKWLRRGVFVLFFLPIVSAQLANFNLRMTYMWWGDEGMKSIAEKLITEANAHATAEHPVNVVLNYNNYPSLTYYLYRYRCNTVQPMLFTQVAWWLYADYAIDDEKTPEISADYPYENFNAAGTKVLKRRTPFVKYGSPWELGFVDYEFTPSDERKLAEGYNSAQSDYLYPDHDYTLVLRDSITDSVRIGNIYRFTAYVYAEQLPAIIDVLVQVKRGDQLMMWKPYDCISFVREEKTWSPVDMLVHSDVELLPGDKLEFCILKETKDPIRVDNIKVMRYRSE